MYHKEMIGLANKIVFIVQGGIGRNFCATAVIRNLKKKYPLKDIFVFASCPDVFMKNPSVKRVYSLGNVAYFQEEFIHSSKSIIIDVEPYRHSAYIYKEKHFTECWCDLIDVECDSIKPEIFFNIAEEELAKDYLRRFDRRMILIQGQGGKIPEQPTVKDRLVAKSSMFRRNLPDQVIQKITDGLIELGFMVGAVCTKNQFLPRGAEKVEHPIRAIAALVPHVAGVISIDSFLLHAVACFKDVPAIGLWGGTSSEVLGYPWQKNLSRKVCDTPHCHRPNSYLFDSQANGYPWDCEHNDICMNFKAEDVLEEFKKLVKVGGEDGKSEPVPATGKRSNARSTSCQKKNHPCSEKIVSVEGEGSDEPQVSADIRAN